jgi:hypothetical protein
MNKKPSMRDVIKKSDKIIKDLFPNLTKKEFNLMLEIIDVYLANIIGVNKNSLPWIKGYWSEWELPDFTHMMRLGTARFFSEFEKYRFKPTKH